MTTRHPSKPDADPCRVVLVGMMGSGKSTVGRLLAERTGWPHHDNDALLADRERTTARELLAARGEAALEAAELAAFGQALALPSPSVVSVAARVILDPDARRAMHAAGTVVWLRASPATIHERARGAAHRPWPDDDPMGWIRATVAIRDPLYASVAEITLDADMTPPARLADAVETHLAARGCLPR